MAKTKIKKIKQDKAELVAMADFYAKQYNEVYFVRDMLADCVIAVECAPSKNPIAEERATGRRDIFGYQDLFLTTRRRIDTNKFGHHMIGYESASGNDTRLATVELGEVPVVSGKTVLNGGSPSVALSPFERSRLESSVRIKQAASKKDADYEVYTDSEGHMVERFETFEVVRMR
jgi:hypothetical protein